MDKRRAYHLLKVIKKVPGLLLVAFSLLFLVIGIFALRNNNLRMLELRAAVFEADKNDGDIESALRTLREHVYAHMNTSLTAGNNAIRPPIQLEHRYNRLLEAELAKKQSSNEQVYTDAQVHCEKEVPTGHSGSGRIPCIQAYVDTHGTKEQTITINKDLYTFDFLSPRWSPDLAGWSLVLSVIFFVLSAIRFLSSYLIRKQLHGHE